METTINTLDFENLLVLHKARFEFDPDTLSWTLTFKRGMKATYSAYTQAAAEEAAYYYLLFKEIKEKK